MVRTQFLRSIHIYHSTQSPFLICDVRLRNVYLLFEIPTNVYGGIFLCWRIIITCDGLENQPYVINTSFDHIFLKKNVINFLCWEFQAHAMVKNLVFCPLDTLSQQFCVICPVQTCRVSIVPCLLVFWELKYTA